MDRDESIVSDTKEDSRPKQEETKKNLPADEGKVDERKFDFESHAKYAANDYANVKERYLELSRKFKSILQESLNSKKVCYSSINNRVKSKESFRKKAELPSPKNPNEPKYENPLYDIKDKAGVRIITFFTKTQEEIDRIIYDEFEVIEKIDRTKEMSETENFGYLSVHYLAKLKPPRLSLTEYKEFKEKICEIQVRTILQHAWAEIEHDIKYKSEVDIPHDIRRRFISIAAILETADREFQFIHDEDKKFKEQLSSRIEGGNIDNIEISTTSVKYLLNKKYGKDARLQDWSYSWIARLIIRLGIKNIDELEKILGGDNYKLLSAKVWPVRPSPVTIVEDLLLLHFKGGYIQKHPLSNFPWFVKNCERILNRAFKGDKEDKQ